MDTYESPNGFCFDVLCSDDPIIDSKFTDEANAYPKASIEKIYRPEIKCCSPFISVAGKQFI